MSINAVFVGAKTTIPLHYQKFDLRSITVCRNGHTIDGTHLGTDTDKKMYLNSMGALVFDKHCHGIFFKDMRIIVFFRSNQYATGLTQLFTS